MPAPSVSLKSSEPMWGFVRYVVTFHGASQNSPAIRLGGGLHSMTVQFAGTFVGAPTLILRCSQDGVTYYNTPTDGIAVSAPGLKRVNPLDGGFRFYRIEAGAGDTAAVLTSSNTETYDFSGAGAETLIVTANGGSPQTFTFPDGTFGNPALALADEVRNRINATSVGFGASTVGGAVRLTSTAQGDAGSLVIGNGTANTILGFTNGQTTVGVSSDIVVTLLARLKNYGP